MKPNQWSINQHVATRNLQPATCNFFTTSRHLKYFKSGIPAFTIMEMIVVLLLSGIIIAAALKLYLNYEGLLRNKNKQMDCGKETLQFYQVFKHEFDNSLVVRSSGSQISFQLSDKPSVQYDFEQNFVTRLQNNLTDTFFVTVNDLTIRKDEFTGMDKMITMELTNCDEVFPVLLVKEYPNDVMMRSPHPHRFSR